MSLLDIIAIEAAMKYFIGETDSVQSVTIKGGKFDGHKALLFVRNDEPTHILYIIDGPLFPFAMDAGPLSLVGVEDIEKATAAMKRFIPEMLICNLVEIGLEYNDLTNTVHIRASFLVTTDKSKAEFKYVLDTGGIILDTQKGL